MQFVGLLLIVNSLVSGAWWIASGRPQMVVAPLCIAGLAAGVFLMRQQPAQEKSEPTPAAALEELARETAVAKTLLADLQDQTAVADWHLKQLDEQLRGMQILPDGRTKIGSVVTGQATVLIPKLETLQKLSADRPAEAYALAAECVKIHEDTRAQIGNANSTVGDLGAETIAWLYATAATAAQRVGEHDASLEWARAAVAERPTTERQFLLVTALINKSLRSEAEELIQRQLQASGGEAAKFRQYLEQYKIPYKRAD
jgi:hypothetical protein